MLNQSSPYLWTYDQNPWDKSAFAETFSVGIYQLVPKSNGKGLKKTKTIRVNGYCMDANAVYAKAAELCRRLNVENVRFDTPPKWLQKQYSIAKPTGMPPKPISDNLTSKDARTLRKRVSKDVLEPAGFVTGPAGTYWRHKADQIHLIDFQPSKYGGEYTVNLGFHYDFIPGFLNRQLYREHKFEHLLDCGLNCRIGSLLPNARDTWFKYGNDREQLLKTMFENIAVSLRAIETWSQIWKSPTWWIENLQPDLTFREEYCRPWRSPSEIWIGSIARHLGHAACLSRQREQMISWVKEKGEHANYYKLKWSEVVMRTVKRK